LWELAQPKQSVVINTIQSDPRLQPRLRELLLEGNVQTLIIFPMVSLADWIGCLLVFY
jgi:GAF domain-containing protein